MSAGRGRGKDLTLPSWMTSSESIPANQSNDANKPYNLAQPITSSQVPFVIPAAPTMPTLSYPPAMAIPRPIVPIIPLSVAPALAAYPPPYVPRPLPTQFPFPAVPVPAPAQAVASNLAAPVASQPTGDPANEKSNWTMHTADDGRRYWYNSVIGTSTYDKPFCLKSPEERSIPPCKWKEYSANGKKYYSDGKESVWEEPEEYKEWRLKVEAIENKKAASATVKPTNDKKDGSSAPVIVNYATRAEAVDAFHALLADFKVSSTAKAKEVKDLCQDDPRWNALKTSGERNQAIAEYQTKKLKIEKEQKALKMRRHRDAFLVMLAENTKIDSRTRWVDASNILKDDNRFKNIEDAGEREDLFNEFVGELIKKEREDKNRVLETAKRYLHSKIDELTASGRIHRSTIWADNKDFILEYVCTPETRALDEVDIKRAVQEQVSKLEQAFQDDERRRKEEKARVINDLQSKFSNLLDILSQDGHIKPTFRWTEVLELPQVSSSKDYTDLCRSLEEAGAPLVMGPEAPSKVFIAVRNTTERILNVVKENYRIDRRIFHDMLRETRLDIRPETTYSILHASAMKFAAVKEVIDATSGQSIIVPDVTLTEDGEELDDLKESGAKSKEIVSLAGQVRKILKERPGNFLSIFEDHHREVVHEYEESLKKQQRRQERFIELLKEYFYRSDQLDISWDDAKRMLDRHSAYDALDRSVRKKLFFDYISDLKKRMESKRSTNKPVEASSTDPGNQDAAEAKGDDASRSREKDETGSVDESEDDDSDDSEDRDDGKKSGEKKKVKKEKHKKDKHSKHKKHKRERDREDESHDKKKHRS